LDWLRRIIIAPDINLAERIDRLTIMMSYEHSDPDADKSRPHPWEVAESDPTHRYYDFKANPELIRTHLEDFVGLSDWPAIQTFNSFLEWLNGPDSALESNDCAFKPPGKNNIPEINKSLKCSGRVMILYRTLHWNTNKAGVEWLKGAIHHYLRQIDLDFRGEEGEIGTTIMKAEYITLPVPPTDQAGFQLMLLFQAWGDSEEETMSNLERLFKNLQMALQDVSSEILEEMRGGE
jgi:hypothetical protein